MRALFAGAAALALALPMATAGCGGEAPKPVEVKKEKTGPSWADVFDGTPDFYAVVRPHAIKRDGLYGNFFKSLLRVAQARTNARGDTMMQALDGSAEIIVGLEKGGDAAVVLRGVPANLDPQKITDSNGNALFRSLNDRTEVAEYELLDRRSAGAGSLFVLPDRTWVGALGDARVRARQAFQTPAHRPAPVLDRQALAAVRVARPLARVLERHPLYGPLTKRLASATFALMPGKEGVVIGLLYEDVDAAAWAEAEAKRVVQELAKPESRAWLRDAKVAYEGETVFIRVALPPRLLDELPNATGADFNL